jgi:hypothetical protein
MTTETIYPRFLGVDSNGDFVWELASGRWTWGDDPFQANTRQRTFTPDRYLEKYGPVEPLAPSGLLGHAPVPAEAPAPAVVEESHEGSHLALGALAAMLRILDDWIEGAHSNHEGMDHRGEPVTEECWTRFHPADIRNMINDAARELGLDEFPKPANPREDEVR